MLKRVNDHVLELVDKQFLMLNFAKCFIPDLQEFEVKIYLDGGVVNRPVKDIKLLVKVEDCVDYCMLLTVHGHVNYVALARMLYQKLNKDVCLSLPDEVSQALESTVYMCSSNKPTENVVRQIYDIFMGVRGYGHYRRIIAFMIASVYCMHEDIGRVQFEAQDGISILRS